MFSVVNNKPHYPISIRDYFTVRSSTYTPNLQIYQCFVHAELNSHQITQFSCHLLRADPNKPDNILRRLSPVTQRHDAIIESSLVPALRNCGVAFSVVKRVSTIVRLKPDLAIEFNDKSTDCLADLQVIHSYSPSYVHTAIEKQLATAEQNKRNKYEQFWNSTETGPLRDFYWTFTV